MEVDFCGDHFDLLVARFISTSELCLLMDTLLYTLSANIEGPL